MNKIWKFFHKTFPLLIPISRLLFHSTTIFNEKKIINFNVQSQKLNRRERGGDDDGLNGCKKAAKATTANTNIDFFLCVLYFFKKKFTSPHIFLSLSSNPIFNSFNSTQHQINLVKERFQKPIINLHPVLTLIFFLLYQNFLALWCFLMLKVGEKRSDFDILVMMKEIPSWIDAFVWCKQHKKHKH